MSQFSDAVRLFAIVASSVGAAGILAWLIAGIVRFVLDARDQKRANAELRRSLRAPRVPHIYARKTNRRIERGPYAKRGDGMDGAA